MGLYRGLSVTKPYQYNLKLKVLFLRFMQSTVLASSYREFFKDYLIDIFNEPFLFYYMDYNSKSFIISLAICNPRSAQYRLNLFLVVLQV